MFATQGKSWFKKMSVGKLKEEGQLKQKEDIKISISGWKQG